MTRILDILVSQFEHDVAIMSQPWMYYCVLPIAAYVVFFLLKWVVLTAPAWLPVGLALSALKK